MEDFDAVPHHSMMYHYPILPIVNLTGSNCTDGVPWILNSIGTCVLNTRQYVAVMAGLMSTLISTVNGLPQIYLNCSKGIPDKALSIFLIVQWLAGDSLNLVGGLLTHQTNVQIIYAIFMVSVDVVMLIQYTFFKIKHSIEDARKAQETPSTTIQDESGSLYGSLPSRSYNGSVMFCCALLWTSTYLSLDSYRPRQLARPLTGRRLLMTPTFFHGTKDEVGFGLGVVSTLCYMGSRLPQIYKNWQRQSTVGVSFGLFFLMILSNSFYGSSILLHSTELYSVLHSLPWILGALGMIFFDCIIMFQFWYYRRSLHLLVIDESGESTQRLIDDV